MILASLCDAPTDGINTQRVDQDKVYEVGDTYTYICDDGLVPTGDTVSTCLHRNVWSLSPPTCTGKISYY